MLRNAIGLFIIATVILVLFLPSFSKMQDLKQKNFDYERQIVQLEKENLRLKEEKRLMEENPEYFEKVAREKMGLIKSGEVVFKMTPPATTQKP